MKRKGIYVKLLIFFNSFKDIVANPIKNLKDFIQECLKKDVGASSQV